MLLLNKWKGGLVLKSKIIKIILAVLGLLVIASVAWYILNQNKPAASTPEQQITAGNKTTTGGGKFSTGDKQELTQDVVRYQPSITPYPGSGDLDWTRNPPKTTISANSSSSSKKTKKTLCEIADLSDKWTNPIEKLVCDLLNFLSDKIIEPFEEFNCMLSAASLQANYDQKITWEYKNGQCKILDR